MKRDNKLSKLLYNLTILKKKRHGLLCLKCGTILISWSRHDFKSCDCPNQAFLDGGDVYLRYGALDGSMIQFVRVSPIREKKSST